MDPPACVQNAMMTKDKKPFTYTPGGIDLSEARSPRLQRRIERNANLGGAGDTPHHPSPHVPITGPLPPSALAAMRPQTQVQVFPSGPAPPAPVRGGAPPPPPPPKQGIPPPPPPPNCPLPTQKVCTSDNLVLERPDMTKIIPENPMAMLRKTSGPQPRKSLVDQMFEEAGKGVPEPKSPPYQQPQQNFQPPSPPQRTQPVTTERGAPISPVPQQTYKPQQQYQQPLPPQQQQYQPPAQQQNRQQQQHSQPAQPAYPEPAREQPRYQPPVKERQPQSQNTQPELKTSTAHLGSLYIPPVNQQNQRKVVSPPSPPERNLDSPGVQTPPLREAPKPWQTKKPQEEVPAWAKRDNQISNTVEEVRKPSPPAAQPQQRWPQGNQNDKPSYNQPQYNQSQPQYQPQPQYKQQQQYQQQPQYRQDQQPIGVRIEIRTNPQQYQIESEGSKPNAVYVTQPLVMQHPGPQPQGVGSKGPRVVPIQIETPRSPAGNDRVLNRQQSWGNNPSQSNSFKIIQKIVSDDDEYENIPITEHSPKFPQNFQQVSRGSQPPAQKGPQVRTIPIQIEGDDTPKPYVHPSEQVVPEPKKYTGSSIPSRSFKILQAMTAPDNNCANVDDQNEEFPSDEWAYPPYYPPYPYPPYWYEYYHYYYPDSYPEETTNKKTTPTSRGVSRSTSPAASGRHTPLHFWGYPPQYCPTPNTSESGRETSTPKCSWTNSYEPSYSDKDGNETDESNVQSDYLPYYDPYYYHYYYGYPPPMYPRYPYFPSDNESSAANSHLNLDEKSKINKKVLEPHPKRVNRQAPEPVSKGIITPTLNIREIIITPPKEEKIESSDCETDTETDDEYTHHLQINPLKSMKSIANITTYSSDEDASKEEGIVEEYSDESNEDIDDVSSMDYEDDQYPHQLSVIMEESERTDSRLRTVSVLSDSTTLAEKSDPEEDEEEEEEEEDVSLVEYKNQDEELPADIRDKSPTKLTDDKLLPEYEDAKPIQTFESRENVHEDDDKKSDESEDWWGIIGKDDDDLPKHRKTPEVEDINSEMIDNDDSISTIIYNEEETIQIENTETEELQCDTENTKEEIKSNDISNETFQSKNNSALSCTPETEEICEYKVVLRRKKKTDSVEDESKPRPRSIYDSLEDIKTESTGSLVKVDNFVGILEQIQKDFGSFLNSQAESDGDKEYKIKNCNFNRPVSMYEMSESTEDKHVDAKEKRFSYSSFEEFTAKQEAIFEENTSSSDDDKPNEVCENYNTKQNNSTIINAVNGSANYNKYNSSLSATPVFKDVNLTIAIDNNKYDKKSSSNDSSNRSEIEESSEETDASCSEKDDKEHSNNNYVQLSDESDIKVPTIKDRIQKLRESISSKRNKQYEQDGKMSTKDKISINESRSKPTSSKSSLKSFEESEEEEVDSGVTSDMSRHISDTEEFPELRKLTKYQRAATHSRLFKLLQEQCDEESDENEQASQRQNLTLHLNENNDFKEPVNDVLVNELIDSLLKLKKGQAFKNLPKEKLYAAAVQILQEDMEINDTPSDDFSSFLSPMRSSTGYSTAVQTPQEFGNSFDDYKQYYESWNRNEENYDIFPSKAFKGLQSGVLGPLGKCPRVLSSKNIHKKLIKLLETSENPSPIPDKPPLETNEVTSAS
ncbi:unnamed protein product [Psylliodes chrysocephalus]|uniref:Uncharacterized protein n=1 Tax=Psylliodes chrysocephalus TaxID=3402493 RepID=A0A9P0GFW2_9CUCU|nr:unnamed protein product [Psylliodes chrysocephala]